MIYAKNKLKYLAVICFGATSAIHPLSFFSDEKPYQLTETRCIIKKDSRSLKLHIVATGDSAQLVILAEYENDTLGDDILKSSEANNIELILKTANAVFIAMPSERHEFNPKENKRHIIKNRHAEDTRLFLRVRADRKDGKLTAVHGKFSAIAKADMRTGEKNLKSINRGEFQCNL